MTTAMVSSHILNVIDRLEPGITMEAKIAQLAEHEIRRRLARYQLTDRIFRQKYGMTLPEFEAAEMVRKLNFSFESESDHQDWDIAVDGIHTLLQQLEQVRVVR